MLKHKLVTTMVILFILCIGIVNASDNETSAPVASFYADFTEGKVPLTVQFTDTSSGEPTSWLWDFGDGSSSDSQNPSHTYMEGTFAVSLTVSNGNGSDTMIDYISADTHPVGAIASISPNPAVDHEEVNLVGLHIYNYSAIPVRYAHRWYSDRDGLVCTGRTLTTKGFSVGNHTISFQFKDIEDQWSDPVYGNLVVLSNTLPVANIDDISPNPAIEGQEVTFIGSGTDDDGVVNGSIIHEYQWWSSIDGMLSTSNQSSFSSSHLSVGSHTITLIVKDHMSKSLPVSAILKVVGNTEYLQVSSEKAISANNPVTITVDVNDSNPTSIGLSIIDSNGATILTKKLTDELESGIYLFEWNATDAEGESLQSGTYKLSLSGTDSSGEPISESMDLTVDNTAPVIVIDDISGVITNEDVVYASSDLTVNVSVDGDVNSVSISLLSDSGSSVDVIDADYEDGIWVGEFDLSSVPDGNYTVEAIATDTAKNSNMLSDMTTVYVDGTAPVLEAVTPANGQTFAVGTSSVDIRFNYSDARMGINASSISMEVDNKDVTANATITESSATYSVTGLAAGSHTAILYVADNLGNEAKFSTTFTIGEKSSSKSSSSSSSSSSGGSGGSTTGEQYANVLVKEVESLYVNKDSHVNYLFDKEGNAIASVQFDALKNSGSIQAIVEVLKGRSSFADANAPGNIYQQMNIWVGKSGFVSPENVENLLIDFKVEKSWLEENNIETDTVKLYRYADGSWVALSTSVTEVDDEYVYFESTTPGFSPFAISSETESVELTDEATLQSVVDEDTTSSDEPVETEAKTQFGLSGTVVVIGGLLAVFAGAYVLYRRQS